MALPRRIMRKAAKGWRLPPETVYVGRGSKWGNPFPFDHQRYLGKAWAVEAYAQWLTATLQGMTLLREHLNELKGKSVDQYVKPSRGGCQRCGGRIGAKDGEKSSAESEKLGSGVIAKANKFWVCACLGDQREVDLHLRVTDGICRNQV